MSVLNTIVRHKREEVSLRKKQVSLDSLMASEYFGRHTYSLTQALSQPAMPGIIAEFKRRSPSLPNLNPTGECSEICAGYQAAGASSVSILTDQVYFGGSDADVSAVRQKLQIPILRKEFIIDSYQVVEAKSMGADVILLIAAILSREEARSMAKIAVECGLQVILEIHDKEEIGHWHESMHCIGVNNRNLANFTTDVGLSRQLYPYLPTEAVKISESGLHDPAVVAALYSLGFMGFLMGEYFLKQDNPADALAAFLQKVKGSVC